jgi:hypothetical protein
MGLNDLQNKQATSALNFWSSDLVAVAREFIQFDRWSSAVAVAFVDHLFVGLPKGMMTNLPIRHRDGDTHNLTELLYLPRWISWQMPNNVFHGPKSSRPECDPAIKPGSRPFIIESVVRVETVCEEGAHLDKPGWFRDIRDLP